MTHEIVDGAADALDRAGKSALVGIGISLRHDAEQVVMVRLIDDSAIVKFPFRRRAVCLENSVAELLGHRHARRHARSGRGGTANAGAAGRRLHRLVDGFQGVVLGAAAGWRGSAERLRRRRSEIYCDAGSPDSRAFGVNSLCRTSE